VTDTFFTLFRHFVDNLEVTDTVVSVVFATEKSPSVSKKHLDKIGKFVKTRSMTNIVNLS